jgi:hypothetical protein
MALLTPELLRRLEQFQLLAARRSKSTAKGERRSKARGQSVEFADFRNYVAGDDFRYLDWNLYGRLDKLFLKLYEEERELPVRIFLDASESMTFGTPPKFDFARQVAAAVGYVALCGFDRVTVHIFPEPDPAAPNVDAAALSAEMAARGGLRSVRGRKSSLQFFQNLSKLTARGAADLNEGLRRGALSSRQTGVAVVLSDFLDPAGYETGLNALIGRGFQVNAIQILAPEELNPGTYGDLRLVDSETGGHAGSDLWQDPQFEHDSCGVGFVVNIKGKNPTNHPRRADHSDQPQPPRRLRLRGQHRRRRGHSDADAARFFKEVCAQGQNQAAAAGRLRRGHGFPAARCQRTAHLREDVENIVVEEGQKFLGWRTVPTNNATWAKRPGGRAVRAAGFHPAQPKLADDMAFERKLYVIRKRPSGPSVTAAVKGGIGFTFPAFPAARWSTRACS